MKVYYAHCVAIYDTLQEARDLELLHRLFDEVVNPNTPEHHANYLQRGLEYFRMFAVECDLIVFRGLLDGTIPSGVAAEIGFFADLGKPALELPGRVCRRTLTREQTKEYINEAGKR